MFSQIKISKHKRIILDLLLHNEIVSKQRLLEATNLNNHESPSEVTLKTQISQLRLLIKPHKILNKRSTGYYIRLCEAE